MMIAHLTPSALAEIEAWLESARESERSAHHNYLVAHAAWIGARAETERRVANAKEAVDESSRFCGAV